MKGIRVYHEQDPRTFTMNYRIINKQVFEQAQLRSVSDVVFTEEELQNGMKLVVSKADPTLALYLVDVDGQKYCFLI